MRVLVLVSMVVLMLAGTALALPTLYLYDDFNDAGVSAGLWTVEDTPNTPVTFDGSKAILNLQEPVTGGPFISRIIATGFTPQLNEAGDSFRFTFDMQQNPAVFGVNGWMDGFHVGQSFSEGWRGGQFGWMNNTGDSRMGSVWDCQNGGDDVNRMYQDLHYDGYMEVERVSGTQAVLTLRMAVYARNAAYDADPCLYEGETPLFERTKNSAWANYQVNDPTSSLRFAMMDAYGSDTAGHLRGENFIDNVFTSVPEPATIALLGLGSLVLLRRRKKA